MRCLRFICTSSTATRPTTAIPFPLASSSIGKDGKCNPCLYQIIYSCMKPPANGIQVKAINSQLLDLKREVSASSSDLDRWLSQTVQLTLTLYEGKPMRKCWQLDNIME